MSDRGFIKLDRKLLNWGWKDDPLMVALWIEILLQANIREVEWHGEKFKPGSFPTSLGKLAKNTGLTISQVRTCLKKLKESGEIFQKVTHRGMTISVVKWGEYQGRKPKDDTQMTHSSHADDTQIATIKEYKNLRSKEYIYKGQGEIVYDDSHNKKVPMDELNELLSLRGEKYES